MPAATTVVTDEAATATDDFPEGTLRPLTIPTAITRDFPETFRAFWPITDNAASLHDLIAQARSDMREVTTRARAEAAHRYGRFTLASAATIPGAQGGLGDAVLVYEAPGRALPTRPYHRARRTA